MSEWDPGMFLFLLEHILAGLCGYASWAPQDQNCNRQCSFFPPCITGFDDAYLCQHFSRNAGSLQRHVGVEILIRRPFYFPSTS